jgi:hypothetical protein
MRSRHFASSSCAHPSPGANGRVMFVSSMSETTQVGLPCRVAPARADRLVWTQRCEVDRCDETVSTNGKN